uniref:Uncharacterized protein n=2 Tax=viral metagenome TaxID=1070528 RepID=A0A6H1ZKY8_9ZZZZ
MVEATELLEGKVSSTKVPRLSKDDLFLQAMQLVREEARKLDKPWSKRVIFSVSGDLLTAWLLAPNKQKFSLDTFKYDDVDVERTLSLCDDIWEGVDQTEPEPPPQVPEKQLDIEDSVARQHVHSFQEVEYTFPEDVHIGYNGQMFHARGGCAVMVPQCILQTYLDAMKAQEEALAEMAALAANPKNYTGVI